MFFERNIKPPKDVTILLYLFSEVFFSKHILSILLVQLMTFTCRKLIKQISKLWTIEKCSWMSSDGIANTTLQIQRKLSCGKIQLLWNYLKIMPNTNNKVSGLQRSEVKSKLILYANFLYRKKCFTYNQVTVKYC